MSEVRDENGKPQRNKNKRRGKPDGSDPEDTAVNAGFTNSKSGPRKRPFKGNRDNSTQLGKILDKPCQIHGSREKPASHTNRNCWVIKQASKALAEEQAKGVHSDDEEDPRPPNNGA
jgi:hypothetical protein